MPTYEYLCENNHAFEEFQSIVAAPIELCPICGGHAERKISGGTGLIFKGSGFYITDYARKGGGEGKETKSLNSHHHKSSGDAPAASSSSTSESAPPAAPTTTEPKK